MVPKRLVLFDIDGTILNGGTLWRECFHQALNHLFPEIEQNYPNVPFGGKTDMQICYEIMQHLGYKKNEIDKSLRSIVDEYIKRSEKITQTRAAEVEVCPGVKPLLKILDDDPEILLGLLTGNVKQGAFIKLSCVGLSHFFDIGVYGDDHWDRYKLPDLAVERVEKEKGHRFSGKQVVIIGDTIHDVNCGKSIGARSIAVGTGKNASKEELLSHSPDFYFQDLSDTESVLEAILKEI